MNKFARYNISFEVVKTSIEKLNPQFSLCDVLVAYHGDNRNYTAISKQTIEDALYSLYGVPIVGEWLEKADDENEGTWGSHGGRIVIDAHGIRFEQTTKPFGFVTKDAVECAEWVTITEKDGHTKHEYLKLSGCILWNGRYEECGSLLEKNYGQSMEIEILDGSDRSDGYFDITKFIFSALCILGTAEPCFESAMIGRHYELDAFKHEVRTMLDEYKRCFAQKETKEDTSKMNQKVMEVLSACTYESEAGKVVPKYEIISIHENAVDVIDREDGYHGYSIPFSIADDESIQVDYENKVEKSIVLGDASEVGFHVKEEIDRVVAEKVAFAIEAYQSDTISTLNTKLKKAEAEYAALKSDYDAGQAKLLEYERVVAENEAKAHREAINQKIEEYADRMGGFSEYLLYRTKVDYAKTVDQVDVDMLLLLGRYHKNGKAGFSYQPITSGVLDNTKPIHGDGGRYGDLLEKVRKD